MTGHRLVPRAKPEESNRGNQNVLAFLGREPRTQWAQAANSDPDRLVPRAKPEESNRENQNVLAFLGLEPRTQWAQAANSDPDRLVPRAKPEESNRGRAQVNRSERISCVNVVVDRRPPP
jgi:hypothetical protein